MVTRTSIPKDDINAAPVPNRRDEVVLDGETVYTTSTPISDALADASSGASITIGPGTYSESVTVSVDDVNISGAGRATIIDGGSSPAITLNADGISVRGLNAKNDTGLGGSVDVITTGDNGNGGDLSDIHINQGDGVGINIKDGKQFIVQSCNVDGTEFGISISSAAATQHRIIGCFCGTNITEDAITVANSEVTVQGCMIDSPGDEGIVVQPAADHTTLSGNVVSSAAGDGIQLNAANVSVVANVIRNIIGDGIQVGGDNCTIVGNDIDNCDVGIDDNATDTLLGFNTISNSTTSDIDTAGATDPHHIHNVLDSTLDNDAETISDTNWIARLVDSPNGHVPNAVLDDGESAEIAIPVPDGEALKVYRWGAYQISDGSTPTDLDVELLDGSDTVQATANTGNDESTDPASPVASHTNSSGSVSIFKLAIANDTGSTISDPGVGGHFAYVVE